MTVAQPTSSDKCEVEDDDGPSLTEEQALARERLMAMCRQEEEFLGPKLAAHERRLFERLHRYCEKQERLEKTSAADWQPRVMFLMVEGPGRLIDHGDHMAFIPHWRLLCVVNRKQAAIGTIRGKIKVVERRLFDFIFWVRQQRREVARLRSQNNLLRTLTAPTHGRRRV